MIRIVSCWLALLLAACVPASLPAPPISPLLRPPARVYYVYIPVSVLSRPAPTPTSPASEPAEATCFNNPKALAFYRLLIGDSRQQRPLLRCHPALVRAAQLRAASMITEGYFAHCDPQGICPNAVARAAGCNLPASYNNGKNYIEELGAGTAAEQIIFDALGNSPGHRTHLFGENEFFRQQDDVGIALGEGGVYGWYWVILIAPCEETSGE